MCRLQDIAISDYQESVTTGQTDTQTDTQMDGQTDAGQSDPYVPLCFAGDTKSGPKHILKLIKVNQNIFYHFFHLPLPFTLCIPTMMLTSILTISILSC